MKQKVATSKTLSSLTGLSIPTTVKYMSLIHGIQEKPKIEIHTPQKTSGEVKTSEIVYILREDS